MASVVGVPSWGKVISIFINKSLYFVLRKENSDNS